MATSKRSVTTTIILTIIATIISASTSNDTNPSCQRPYKNVGTFYGPRSVPYFVRTPVSYDLDCPTDYEFSAEYLWGFETLSPPTPIPHPNPYTNYFNTSILCRHSLILLQFTSTQKDRQPRALEGVRIAHYNNTLYDFSIGNPSQSRRYPNLQTQLNDHHRSLADIPVCTQVKAPCFYTIFNKFGELLERYRDGAAGFTNCTDEVKVLVVKYYRQYKFPPSWPAAAG